VEVPPLDEEDDVPPLDEDVEDDVPPLDEDDVEPPEDDEVDDVEPPDEDDDVDPPDEDEVDDVDEEDDVDVPPASAPGVAGSGNAIPGAGSVTGAPSPSETELAPAAQATSIPAKKTVRARTRHDTARLQRTFLARPEPTGAAARWPELRERPAAPPAGEARDRRPRCRW
jgi:hypothetical protein